jgi:hypothetical protein
MQASVRCLMVNQLFRDAIRNKIDYAVKLASCASGVKHKGLEGLVREISLANLFQPLLPFGVCTGTGKIIDCNGQQSRQMDVVIYSKLILPSLMFDEKTGLFPVETCLYCIEVKTEINSTQVKDAIKKGGSVKNLAMQSGYVR